MKVIFILFQNMFLRIKLQHRNNRMGRYIRKAERLARRKKRNFYVIQLSPGKCIVHDRDGVKRMCRSGVLACVTSDGKRVKASYTELLKHAIYTTK